jgi:hypothetical protein
MRTSTLHRRTEVESAPFPLVGIYFLFGEQMALDGKTTEQLYKAVLSAFPQRSALARLLWFEMDLKLDEIVGGISYGDTVFSLLSFLSSRGIVEDFVKKAHEQNPGNSDLEAVAATLLPPVDPFIYVYFSNGGDLLPPGDKEKIAEHFDDYNASYEAGSEEDKFRLRRLNTEAYLAKWGLQISALKHKLQVLGYYQGHISDEYCEELGDAIARFQRQHMMRHIDGYFGELTYRQMVTELILAGLAKRPPITAKPTGTREPK